MNKHCFRSRISIVTQLFETLHDLTIGTNERNQTAVIFRDFSKAFDRVSHTKLLHKLKYVLGDEPIYKMLN